MSDLTSFVDGNNVEYGFNDTTARTGISNVRAEQTVLGSKNLCVTFPSLTRYGATFTVDSDGCVHVSNTATQQTEDQVSFILKKGTYVVSGSPTGSTSGQYDIYIQKGNPSTTIARAYDGSTMTEFTLDSDTSIKVNCRVPSGALDTTKIFKPMIRLATDPDDTYVPYAMTNRDLTVIKEGSITSTVGTVASSNTWLRKQGNIVNLNLSMSAVTADANAIIATLSDFKPDGIVWMIGDNVSNALIFYLATDGNIRTRSALSSSDVRINVTYIVK